MLPADCARRLVSLLTQALEECAEKQRQLQQDLARCHAVLGDWNSEAPDSPTIENRSRDSQERGPSAKELEELELLNKALEKALRIRTKFLSRAPPCEAAEGAKAQEKKPVADVAVKQPGAVSKESVSKSVKAMPVCQKTASPRKPSAYVLKAPYWTEQGVKRTRRKTPARLSCKMPGKRTPKGAASPKATRPRKITGVECGTASAAENPRTRRDAPDSRQKAKPSSSLGNSTSAGDFVSANHGTEQQLSGESPPKTHAMPHTSTLQEKGSSLKLPLPYRKVSSKLAGLWEEAHLCQTSPEAAAARDHFIEKLQATFCTSSPSFSLAEVEKELTSLRGVSSLLSQSVESETPAFLGENPTWEREYESLMTLEGLQPIITQCLDEVHQLEEAVASHVQLFSANSAPSEADVSAEGPRLRRLSCGRETLGPVPALYYSSLKELQEVEALALQVAMVRQQIDIQKVLESELLPLLEPGPAPQGSRASLYRAVYTLLCEGNERFPALVSEEDLSSDLEP